MHAKRVPTLGSLFPYDHIDICPLSKRVPKPNRRNARASFSFEEPLNMIS